MHVTWFYTQLSFLPKDNNLDHVGSLYNEWTLNAMIRNIKIHNIFYIIEISKSMEPNKCTH